MILDNDRIYALLRQLAVFSPETYEHCVNVSNISVSFARDIGLSNGDVEKLRIAGLLHDIGKLKIPSEILNKPSKLTKEEYEVIKNHPKYGVDLLANNGFLDKDILYLISCHHERIDGLGYPRGLKEESISELAKILIICDCYDAMRSSRNYDEGHDIEYIKKEFLENSDTQFDSRYVKLFLSYLDKELGSKRIQ